VVLNQYGHCDKDKQIVNATIRGKIQRAACKVALFYTEKSTRAPGPTQTQWVPGVLSQGVKGPVRKDDHSPVSSAEVKISTAASPSPICFHYLYRDNFITPYTTTE
jgi:hypothetical protein